jgi:ribonuclease VapC
MVIDTSALIALLLGEPETAKFVAGIAATSRRLLSASSYVETAIVIMARLGPRGRDALDRLIARLGIEIVPFTQEQAALAVTAYRRYGKGSGHPARLNFGDCFSYALAKFYDEPILFKGDDFTHSDLAVAVS